jgi:hypothetical protein
MFIRPKNTLQYKCKSDPYSQVRAAMAVESAYGGYLSGGQTATTQLNKVYTVADAAIAVGKLTKTIK